MGGTSSKTISRAGKTSNVTDFSLSEAIHVHRDGTAHHGRAWQPINLRPTGRAVDI